MRTWPTSTRRSTASSDNAAKGGGTINEQFLFDRWIGLLRFKAKEYEHVARKDGRTVLAPSLDDICNEMNAYQVGRGLFPTDAARLR